MTATTTGKSIRPSFTGYFRHFPPAAASPQHDQQQTDGQVALLRNLVEQLRNDLVAREEDHRKREEDLRQERDRWHDAFQSAQRQLPAPAQPDALGGNKPGNRLQRTWRWLRSTG